MFVNGPPMLIFIYGFFTRKFWWFAVNQTGNTFVLTDAIFRGADLVVEITRKINTFYSLVEHHIMMPGEEEERKDRDSGNVCFSQA